MLKNRDRNFLSPDRAQSPRSKTHFINEIHHSWSGVGAATGYSCELNYSFHPTTTGMSKGSSKVKNVYSTYQ
ncbi:hypothetical protein ACE6H2_011827 [Prunus campanulata]